MEASRKRHLSMAEDLQPKSRRRHTMANPHLQFFLMSVCILATQTTKGAFGCVSVGALNRVVYEGATNTTLTCLTVYAGGHMDWILYPFAFPGSSEMVSPTQKGQLRPDSNGFFAMIHQLQSTAHTLVVFNATVSPSARMSFSTAGVYCCTDQTIEVLSHLVVIRSDPICSSNYTQSTLLKWGDVIQLSCTIVYGSMRKYPIDAVMTWSVNGQPIPADNAIFTIASSPTEVTARSTLHISKYFGASYECATTFSQPSGDYPADPTHVMATNAPDYLKKCTISTADVVYNYY